MSAITIAINLIATNGTGAAFNALGTSVTGAAAKLQGFRSLLKDINPTIAALGSAMVGSAAAFELFKGPTEAGVASASELQQALLRLQFATQENTRDIPLLTAAVNELAINTMFGVGEATGAFERLTEMGFNTQQVLYGMSDGASKLMDGTLHAAEAVNGLGNQALYLGQALKSSADDGAQLLGSVLHTFAADGMDAKEAANQIAAAFFNGVPDVQALQEAIRNGGSTAAAVGVTFQDFAITLDLLSQAGLPASMAATSLNYYISQLSSPTLKAAKDLQDLGLIIISKTSPAFESFAAKLSASGAAGRGAVHDFDGTITSLQQMYKAGQAVGLIPLDKSFNAWAITSGIMSSAMFDAQGNFLGLKNATDKIDTALHNVGNRQAELGYIRDIFNIRGGQDARLLSSLDSFDEKYDATVDRFKKTDIGKLASQQLGTLAGAMDQLKDTFTSALATAFLPLLQPLTDLVKRVTDLASWFMNLDQDTKTAIATFLLITTVVTGLTMVVLGLIVGIFGFIAILEAAGISIAAVGTGLAAVAGGIVVIGGLIAGVVALKQQMEDNTPIGNFFTKLTGGMISADEQSKTMAGSFDDLGVHTLGLQGATKQLTGVYAGLHNELDSAKNTWQTLHDNTKGNNDELDRAAKNYPTVTGILSQGGPIVASYGDAMGTTADNTKTANDNTNDLSGSLDHLGKSFQDLGTQLGQFQGVWNVLLFILMSVGGILNGVVMGVEGYFSSVLTGVINMGTGVVEFVTGLLQLLLGITGDFFGVLGDILHGDTDKVGKDMQKAFSDMGEGIGHIWQGICDFFTGLWQATVGALIQGVVSFVQNVISWFQNMFDTLVGHSIIPDLVRAIVDWFHRLFATVPSIVSGLVDRVKRFFSDMADRVRSTVSQWVADIKAKAGELRDRFLSAIASLPDRAQGTFQTLVDKARSLIGRLGQIGWDAGRGLIQNLLDGIGSLLGSLISKIAQVANIIHGPLGHSVPQEGPLKDDDQWGAHLVDNLIGGIDRRLPALAAAARSVAATLSAVTPATSARSGMSVQSGTIVIPINLDGKNISEYTLDLASRRLRQTGNTRHLR